MRIDHILSGDIKSGSKHKVKVVRNQPHTNGILSNRCKLMALDKCEQGKV